MPKKLFALEAKNPNNLKVMTLDLADEDSINQAADDFDGKQLDVLINCGGE